MTDQETPLSGEQERPCDDADCHPWTHWHDPETDEPINAEEWLSRAYRNIEAPCPHEWSDRGTPGDRWQECWLCRDTRNRPGRNGSST